MKKSSILIIIGLFLLLDGMILENIDIPTYTYSVITKSWQVETITKDGFSFDVTKIIIGFIVLFTGTDLQRKKV